MGILAGHRSRLDGLHTGVLANYRILHDHLSFLRCRCLLPWHDFPRLLLQEIQQTFFLSEFSHILISYLVGHCAYDNPLIMICNVHFLCRCHVTTIMLHMMVHLIPSLTLEGAEPTEEGHPVPTDMILQNMVFHGPQFSNSLLPRQPLANQTHVCSPPLLSLLYRLFRIQHTKEAGTHLDLKYSYKPLVSCHLPLLLML